MDVSCIVLAKDEAEVIEKCLRSLQPLDPQEIILINDMSTDNTVNIAHKYKANVIDFKIDDFSAARNFAKENAGSKWLLYIDADERLSPELADEINNIVSGKDKYDAYEIRRTNFYFGKRWPKEDRLVRLMQRSALNRWNGMVHETPQINGTIGELKNELLHDTHRNFNEMITNTLKWSKIEAKLRLDAHHPPVVWWRIPRVMLPAFWNSYVSQGGWKVGTVGLIESFYQAFSIFITYARLWEMQQKKKVD